MALTADRRTQKRAGTQRVVPVAAGAVIYAGALIMKSITGYAEAGATALSKVALGMAEKSADNTGGLDGAKTVPVLSGTFTFKNSGTDAITIADVGNICFIEDDETVAKTDGAGTRSAAGIIFDIDADGIHVTI